MKTNIVVTLVIVIIVWLIHGMLLVRISRLEIAINNEKKELELVEKDLNAKIIEYDTKIDLEKIGREMKVKQKMKMANSDDFYFFEIED